MSKKTKILFISHGINDSGWGQMTANLLTGLSEHFDVVSRISPVLKSFNYEDLASKDLEGVTHAIHYTFPKLYKRVPNLINIGLTEMEYENSQFNEWYDHFEVMDQIWTSNTKTLSELKKYCSVPSKLLHHYIDTTKYGMTFNDIQIKDGNYNFYTISDLTPRKNLRPIIEAYHCEFDPSEPVNLLIKSNKNIHEYCKSIKTNLRLYKDEDCYSPEIIFTKKMTNEQIYSLHQLSDCYINSSLGESFGIPMIDAVGFGNLVLSPPNGNLITQNNIKCTDVLAKGGGARYFENARNIGKEISVLDLMKNMRKAYEGKLKKQELKFKTSEEYCKAVSQLLNLKTSNNSKQTKQTTLESN